MTLTLTVTDEEGNTETATVDVVVAAGAEDTEVPSNWSLVPQGLGVGDRFRLIFISSGTRNGASSDIADYNTFVQTAAAAGHADIQQYSSTFRVVGSTADVDARDNTATTYTADDKGVAIYWLGGNKVVDDYEDFYDGDWDDEANAKDESGSNRTTSFGTHYPYTGSDHDGTEAFSGTSSRALGASSVQVGQPNSSTSGNGPLRSAASTGNASTRPLYGLSGVFVVAVMAVTSDDATLSALSLSGITLLPSFAADTLTYTASVDNDVTSTTVTAAANDDGATVAIVPADADDTADGHQVTLGVGDTAISVTVTAEDETTVQTYAVTVTLAEAINNPPVFTDMSAIFTFINENAQPGAVAVSSFTAKATDPDGDDLTYSLHGADADAFNIDPSDGEVTTKSGVTYDYEEQSVYSVTRQVSDGKGGTDTQSVTISLRDVDEPPSAPAAPTVSAVGGSSDSLLVEWAAPDNSGKPDIESYDLQYRKGTTGDFTDGPQDETVASATIDGLDADSAYQVRVRATNDEGDSGWSSAGSGTTNAQTPPPDVHFIISPDSGTYAIGTKLSVTVVFNAAVTVSGTPQLALDIGGEPRQANYASGFGTQELLFSYTVVEDDEDTDGIRVPSDSLTLNGGAITAGGIAATLTHLPYAFGAVLVDGIRPTLASATVAADGTEITLVFDEPYDDGAAVGLRIMGAPPSVTAAGSSVTVGLWSNAVDADGKHRRLEFKNLSPTITYGQVVIVSYTDPTAGDDANVLEDKAGNDVASFTTGSGGVPAVVNNVPEPNTAPAFTTGADFLTNEHQAATFQVTAMDADAGDEVTYAITGGADTFYFQINATTGLLVFPLTLDHENPEDDDGNNVYLVTVTATGGTGARTLTTDQDITVTVTDVDEPPSAPATPTVSAVSGSSDSLSVTWTAPDNSGKPDIASYDLQYRKGTTGNFADGPQDVTGLTDTIGGLDADSLYQVQVRATNDEGDGAWSSAGSGTTNALAGCGTLPTDRLWSACLTVGEISSGGRYGYQAADSTGSLAPATFDVGTTTYTVTHLFDNDAFGGSTHVAITLSPVLSEDDAGSLTLHLGDDTSLSFGDATYTTPSGFSRHLWDLSAALGWSEDDAIVVGITQEEQANTAPAFTTVSDFSRNENKLIAFGVNAMDADDGDDVTYAITGGADLALFQIDATSGVVTGPIPDHESPADADGNNVYLVTVTATGGTGARALSTDLAITVTVTDLDEPPATPAPPTVDAVDGTTDSLSVTWTALNNSGKPDIDSYDLQYRKGTTGVFTDGSQDVTGLTANIDGLDADSLYQVQVRATNEDGDGFWSRSGSGSTNAPTDPTGSDNLTATAHTGKIRLEWTGSADAYEFRRKEDGGVWSAWTAAETRGWFVLRNATTLDDYDVLALTEYTYQVRGAGAAGNLGEASATLGPPITLRLGATEYRVDEGAGELFFTVLAETPAGLGRYDRDIRPSFTSAGVVGPLPEGPLVKTQEDYELLIESLRIEPGDFVLVNGMYVASRLRSIGIVDDTLVEGDETFELRLLLAGGVSRFFTLGAGDGRAEVTIVDNDTGEAPTSEPATVAPLTGFELVDATAHLDAGAVEDGATLTGIDPAKVYGFRANVASVAELKSVKLELSGPGPDDRVARTDNDEPYALHGDSGGHEHGAALPAGSYTLTATAHSAKDGGGSELGTLSVEFTVAGEPLTARFEGMPEGTHGGAGMPFAFRLSFSEAVSTTPEALRDHALEVTNATVEAVSRVDDRSDLWEVRLTPESDAVVTVSLLPAADCDAAGAVCTEDGRMLSFGVARVILGPPPNSPATGQPSISGTALVGQTLTADTTGIVDEDGLDNVTFSYQWMADDANIQGATGSTYTLADRDKGKTIKVRVSFTDDANNEESLPSAATDAVTALPGKPQSLAGEATAQEIQLTWKAPTGPAVVEYVVYRGILQNGSMNGQALSKYATIDAAGKAMTYTDDNVEEGVEYRYRVAAVNSDGEGKKSTWLDIAAE